MAEYDAVVVGSGPNGLSAAIEIARHGRSVLVIEKSVETGGGMRTAELTLPGFRHDVCAAVLPFGVSSPFFRSLPLERHGLEWVQPEIPLAHPLEGRSGAVLHRSLPETVSSLGEDGASYKAVFGRLVSVWDDLEPALLSPIRSAPLHPVRLAAFGRLGLQPASRLAQRIFATEAARALFAGNAAHSILPLERPWTSSFGLVLITLAHTRGWPSAHGGTQRLAEALTAHLIELGGRIETGRLVDTYADIPSAKVVMFDTSPGALAKIAGERLPARFNRRLTRFRHGPGAFKLDLALAGPIPWTFTPARRAGTVHVGGSLREIAESERTIWKGAEQTRPFVIVAQPSVADTSRAPMGDHVVWAYCHVPSGSVVDMTTRIEDQIERYAPGFRDLIIGRHTMSSADLERYNPNYVGGDIAGGAHSGLQLVFRPTSRMVPYRTPTAGIYLCSASTPPGAGVHGMSGYWAARAALKKELR